MSEQAKDIAGLIESYALKSRLSPSEDGLGIAANYGDTYSNAYDALSAEFCRYRQVVAIAQRLRQLLDPTEILDQTVTAVQQLLAVDRAVIYRFNAQGQVISQVEKAESVDAPRQVLVQALTPELQSFYHQANPLVIEDIQQTILPPEIAEHIQQQQARAILIAPILREKDLLGIVCAHQCQASRPWQDSEIESLRQLATEVAIALYQAELQHRLHHEVKERTTALQTALSFESLLKRITDKVRDSLDESQILQAAVQELTLGLGLGGCNASVYDLTQGTSTIRYEYIHSIPAKRKVSQMEDFPEIYEQLKDGHYFQFCSLLPNPDRGRVSMLACPIFVDPQSSEGIDQAVLGDLWLIHNHDHTFDDFQVRLVQQVANQCAIAIRQARLYQAAQRQVVELEKLNRLKDEFLSTVSHELRTPIANLKMAIHMLRIAPTEDKRKKYLEILEKESAREADLINDLLDLQRLEADSTPLSLEEISLREWVGSLVEPFYSRLNDQEQYLSLEFSSREALFMVSDPTFLRRILLELLNNACKYTAPGGKIGVRVDHLELPLANASKNSSASFSSNSTTSLNTRSENPSVGLAQQPAIVFIVRNQAHISASELPRIFDKFYRCPNADPWSRGGTGLGLALVQKLVGQLQGKIVAESHDGWTTFTATLPQYYSTNPAHPPYSTSATAD